MQDDTEKITIRLPRRFIRNIDALVRMDDFSSRSEAIRTAVRDMLYARMKEVPDKVSEMKKIEGAIAELEETEAAYMKR
jgi:Arc/MetJ-type ribon-helix-helix transcriptional regulator